MSQLSQAQEEAVALCHVVGLWGGGREPPQSWGGGQQDTWKAHEQSEAQRAGDRLARDGTGA